jgi:putative SOS response-associated peptidase YedK
MSRRCAEGLVLSWVPDRSIANRMINGRAETITEKPSLRRLVEGRHCLIPADALTSGAGMELAKFWFGSPKEKGPFAFAGLWDMCSAKRPAEMLYSSQLLPLCLVPSAPHSQSNAGDV